jgi:predicted GNAT superfamily acetyltransferase
VGRASKHESGAMSADFGGQLSDISLRRVTEADLEDVLRLAEAVQLRPGIDTRRGFLVSALPRETYAAALSFAKFREDTEHVVFLAAETRGKLVGFLFGYNDVYANKRSGGQSEKDIASFCSESYYILKQIASDRNARTRGIGRALVAQFLNDIRCAYVFSAIVLEPPNPASSDFHEKMGFAPVFRSTSRNSNGQTYPNQVWMRPWGPG